jgi:hypothetical protein
MADNQALNVTPPPKEAAATEKPKMVGVIDQLLNVLSDKVLNSETALRENTAQLQLMANSVELVRGIPAKIEAVEQRMITTNEAVSKLRERIVCLEAAVRHGMDGSLRLEGAIQGLGAGLQQHAQLFEKPLHKSVQYRHVVGRAAWIIGVLSLLCAGSVGLCVLYHGNADRHADSDIQWRAAQLITDSATLFELQSQKQQYAKDPEQFRKEVVAEEERRAVLAERTLEMNQKIQEVDELKKKRKQR